MGTFFGFKKSQPLGVYEGRGESLETFATFPTPIAITLGVPHVHCMVSSEGPRSTTLAALNAKTKPIQKMFVHAIANRSTWDPLGSWW